MAAKGNLMDEIFASKPASPERLTALQRFISVHNESSKLNMVNDLVKVVRSCAGMKDESETLIVSDKELAASLSVLRIVARELVALGSLLENKSIEAVMALARLLPATNNTTELENVVDRNADVRAEAYKCLVNLIVKKPTVCQYFVGLRAHEALISSLQELFAHVTSAEYGGDPTGENFDALLFPIARLLFSVTRPEPGNEKTVQSALELGVVDVFTDWIQLFSLQLTNASSMKIRGNADLVVQLKAVPDWRALAERTFVQEILKTLLNVIVDVGPLGRGDLNIIKQHVKYWNILICALMKILRLRPLQRSVQDPVYEIQNHAVSCLVNVPVEVIGVLCQREDGTNGSDEEFASTVHNVVLDLVALLDVSLNSPDEPPTYSVPLIMLMANVAKGVSSSRSEFIKELFPGRDLEREIASETAANISPIDAQAKTVGNALIHHMTAINMALKHWTNELLLQICDEKPEVFVRLTGFGNAAGHLVMRNMAGMGQYMNAQPTRKADVEQLLAAQTKASTTNASNSNASAKKSDEGNDEEDDYDSEEEAKAMQMMEKLHALEKRGVIKVVRGGTQEPQSSSSTAPSTSSNNNLGTPESVSTKESPADSETKTDPEAPKPSPSSN